MKITLVRHPQTTANQKKIIYGKTDYPYTSLGEQQVHELVKYFENKYRNHSDCLKMMTSPAERAAKLALQIGLNIDVMPTIDQRLSEMNFGLFEGLSLEQAKAQYPQAYDDFVYRFETTSIPEGESYQAFRLRITDFINDIAENEDLLLVTHGAVVREFLEQILDLKTGDSWKFLINNGTIIELEQKGNHFLVRQIIQPT